MKKLIVVVLVLVISASMFVGCGNPKTIDGVYYDTYGLLNKEKSSSKIEYEISMGNVLWAAILSETIVAPIYFIGFSLYNPIALKVNENTD